MRLTSSLTLMALVGFAIAYVMTSGTLGTATAGICPDDVDNAQVFYNNKGAQVYGCTAGEMNLDWEDDATGGGVTDPDDWDAPGSHTFFGGPFEHYQADCDETLGSVSGCHDVDCCEDAADFKVVVA